MKIFKNKYRIVTDEYNGYEVQCKKWYSFFWIQCHLGNNRPINTFATIEEAKDFVSKLKRNSNSNVVEYL